jgi:exopolysaccharide production protein ExoZ
MNSELIYIQYLRGIAALLVVYTHSIETFESIRDFFPHAIGNYGVDLFFVISGFIMVYSTHGKRISPAIFMLRRFERIAPLYWFFTTVLIFIALIKPDMFSTVDLNLSHTISSYLFFPQYSTSEAFRGMFYPVLYPGWTLNYEMAFYVVFAFSLLFAEKYRLALMALILCTLTIVGTLVEFEGIWKFYTNQTLLEFLLGVILGYLFVNNLIKPNRNLGLVALLTGLVLYLYLHNNFELHRFYSSGLSAALVILAALLLSSKDRVQKSNWLSLMGDASYSIYLSHFFSIGLFSFVRQKLGLADITDMSLIVFFIIVAMIFSTLVGIVVYKLIEQPINLKLRNKRH